MQAQAAVAMSTAVVTALQGSPLSPLALQLKADVQLAAKSVSKSSSNGSSGSSHAAPVGSR
jgi:hypothetical protein